MRTIQNLSENFSDGLLFPKGTSAERGNPEAGYFRYNTETKGIEVYDGTSWSSMDNTPSYVTDGLILNLDAGNLNSYAGSGSTWTDLSQDGNDGTINGATYDSNNYFDFDGSNDKITLPSTDICNWGSGSYSYVFWVQFGSTSGSYRTVFSNYKSGAGNKGMIIGLKNGKISSHLPDSQGSVDTGVAPDLNAWMQMVVTKDGTNHKVYLNGSVIGSITNASATLNNMPQLPELGHIPVSSVDGWLNGKIAIAMVYNAALSETQVTQNFNATKTRFGL